MPSMIPLAEKLSVETRYNIASWMVSQADVLSLCHVSSQWVGAARRILYKKLVLEYDSESAWYTVRMLKRNPLVRKAVKYLYITAKHTSPFIMAEWYNVADLRGLDSVRTVQFSCLYYYPPLMIQEMVGIIYAVAPHLQKIQFFGGHAGRVYVMENLPVVPKCLTDVTVHCDGFSCALLSSTFLHNPSSLTSLSLPCLWRMHEDIATLLSVIRFPMLETFLTSNMDDTDHILDFLAAHPSIKTCSIELMTGFELHSGSPKNILPNLVSLSANLAVIVSFAQICTSLQGISSLDILDDYMQDDAILTVKKAIDCLGGFPRMHSFKIREPKQIVRVLCFIHFPAVLQRFSIIDRVSFRQEDLVISDELIVEVAECFNHLPNLKRLDFSERNVTHEQMLLITQRSQTLQTICLYGSYPNIDLESKIIQRVGGPQYSSTFQLLDLSLSRVWWEWEDGSQVLER